MENDRKEQKWLGLALLALALFWLFRAVILGTGFFFGDFANQDLPKLFFNAGELLQGRFPAWCPYHDLGRPFGQMAWHSVFYPLYLLCVPFAKDLAAFEKAVSFIYVFQVFFGALGVYFLLRFWKVSRPAATAAAAAAGYCASVVITMTSANNGAGYGFIPWIMLAMEHMKAEAENKISLKSLSLSLIGGGALGFCFLVGVIQRMPYMAAFLFAFFLYELIELRGEKQALIRFLLQGALFLATGLLISAILVVPGLEYYGNSGRPEQDIYKNVSDQASWYFFLTNIIPDLFGRVKAPNSGSDWNLFWGGNSWHLGEFWQYWCRVAYTGLWPFLALLSVPFLLRKKFELRTLFFALVVLIAVLYIYGLENPFQYFLASLVKPLRNLRIPVRYAYFISLPAAILFAFAFDSFWPAEKTEIKKGFWLFLFASLAVIGLAVIIGLKKVPDNAVTKAVFNFAVLRQYVIFLIGIALYLIACKKEQTITKWAFAALIVFDLASFGGEINACPQSAAESNAANPVSMALKADQISKGPKARCRYRWDAVQATQKTVIWGLDSVNGYIMTRTSWEQPLWNARKQGEAYKKRFDEIFNIRYDLNNQTRLPAEKIPKWARGFTKYGIFVKDNIFAMPRAWFVPTAVREDEDPASVVMSKDFEPSRKVVISGAPVPENLSGEAGEEGPFGKVTLTDYAPQEIKAKVNAEVPGYVVFSELYYPGWTAVLDEKPAPILRADAALRAVQVSAGEHTITLQAHVSHQSALIICYVLGLVLFLAAAVYRTSLLFINKS